MHRIITKIGKKVFEPMADAIKNTSQSKTKTITETSIKNNKVLENINEKILDFMDDQGMIAPLLTSSLVNRLEPENKSQSRIKKELNSTGMNDFLINRRNTG